VLRAAAHARGSPTHGDAPALPCALPCSPSHYTPTHTRRNTKQVGPDKGAIFERVLEQRAGGPPRRALEVGTFLGYSAVRTARHLAQPGGLLVCIEANPQNAAVAREVVAYAGLGGCVTVLDGLSGQVIPRLPLLLAQLPPPPPQQQQQQQQQLLLQAQDGELARASAFDVVFLDHSKRDYLPDLQRLEQLGLVAPRTTVLADNVLYPGAPGARACACAGACAGACACVCVGGGRGGGAGSTACGSGGSCAPLRRPPSPGTSLAATHAKQHTHTCTHTCVHTCVHTCTHTATPSTPCKHTPRTHTQHTPTATALTPYTHTHTPHRAHAGYLEYLDASGRYETRLLNAPLEYQQAWNPDWEAEGKEDALAVSLCVRDLADDEAGGAAGGAAVGGAAGVQRG
jgi:predicted O-methyltransferase YrrM